MRERWNQRYLAARTSGGDEAVVGVNPWLVEHRSLLLERAPGRALDVACGRGGNAFFLADLGFQVSAVDLSDVAVGEVVDRARSAEVEVSAEVRDLEAVGLPEGQWSVIVMLRYLQRSLFAEMIAGLEPGGLVLIETFLRGHIGRGGKPFNPDFTLAPGELRAAFEGLEVLDYRERVVGHRALAGIVARRALGS